MLSKFHYVLMDEAGDDGAAGGGGDAGDDAGQQQDQEDKIDPNEYRQLKASHEELMETFKKLETNNKALVQEKIDAKKKAEQAALDAAKKDGDVETIEKSWSEKYSSLENEKVETVKQYETMVRNLTVGATASSMAAEIARPKSAEVLMPHIERRLTTEIKDGKAITKVLDKDGRPSAMTIEELKKEFITNEAFAPIINGTKASGTGYRGGDWGSGDGNKTMTRHEFESMPQHKQAAISKDIMTGKIKLVDA